MGEPDAADSREDLARALAALANSDPSERQDCVYNMRQHGVHAVSESDRTAIVSALVPLLGDPSPGVRSEVAITLGMYGDERTAEPLLRLLNDLDPDVADLTAQYGFKLLGKLVLDSLLRALADAQTSVRMRAIVAIGYLGTTRGLWAVPEPQRKMHRFALDDAELHRAGQALNRALEDQDEATRQAARTALFHLGFSPTS